MLSGRHTNLQCLLVSQGRRIGSFRPELRYRGAYREGKSEQREGWEFISEEPEQMRMGGEEGRADCNGRIGFSGQSVRGWVRIEWWGGRGKFRGVDRK